VNRAVIARKSTRFARSRIAPSGVHLALQRHMSSPFRFVAFVTCALLATPAVSHADPIAIAHIRTASRDVQQLMQYAAERSPSFRALIDRLEQSDVIAYVRVIPLNSITLEGRLRFMTAVAGVRYVLVELGCARPLLGQLATLAHELHHAAEIAAAPAVVDNASLIAHYERIGSRSDMNLQVLTYETDGAQATALRVRRELADADAGAPSQRIASSIGALARRVFRFGRPAAGDQ
jgi:hypothetical protein